MCITVASLVAQVLNAGGRLIEFAQVHYVSQRFALMLEIRRDEE